VLSGGLALESHVTSLMDLSKYIVYVARWCCKFKHLLEESKIGLSIEESLLFFVERMCQLILRLCTCQWHL
jgi:hypothetical protein